MQCIYYCLFAVFSVSVTLGREIKLNDPNMPIKVVRTSYGHADNERVDHIRAVIRPHHVKDQERINFSSLHNLNEYFLQIKNDGDEKGLLVAAQFSGPAEWYNLSPQNMRVNRAEGFPAITTDWYGSECEVRRFLDKGGDRFVLWLLDMSYVGDSNRPDTYHLQVSFFEGRNLVQSIDTTIRNPFLSEDSNFWNCKSCRSNRHEHDELRKTGEGCSQG